MEVKPLKTVRFTKVVEESGQPEPVTLWTAPEEDRDFARAMREGRVLTVVQRNQGTKADYGLVGFFQEPLAAFLVFPKKLPHEAGTKVVGIKYEQLAESKPKGPVHKPKPEGPPGVRMQESVTPQGEKAPEGRAKAERIAAAHPEPEQPKAKKPEPAPVPTPPRPPPPPPPPPKLYRFRGAIEITLKQVIPVEVEATTAKEAARLMREKMEEAQPSLESAKVKKRLTPPKPVDASAS